MSLRLWLVVAVMAPMAAHAASYKCVVDGKTTYQGQPCSEDVNNRGTASPMAPAAGGAPGPAGAAASPPKQELQRRDLAARTDLEPLARNAFAAVKSGNLNAYTAMLCPKPRAAFATKAAADGFRSEGQGYVQSRTELAKATEIDREGVTFVTAEAAGYAGKAPRLMRVHFDWVDSKPCITHIDSVLKADYK
jgi:hypothetical protein